MTSPEEQPEADKGIESSELPPIPPEGTAAPSDPDRVFGRRPDAKRRSSVATDEEFEPERAVPYDPRPGRHGGFAADDERQLRLLHVRGRVALILGVGGLVFSVPISPLGLALSLGAVLLGLTTIRRSRRVALPAPGAVPGLVVGIVATLISLVVLWIIHLFYDELSDWQECMSGANTRAGQETCQLEFSERAYDRIDELLGRR